ncbi:MAG: hypothetical protein OXR62_14205 [Ahrensia sp.]|nr:hypothetical protein [Ahrensia sp.]
MATSKSRRSRRQKDEDCENLLEMATERYCDSQHFDRLTMRQYCEAFDVLSSQVSASCLQRVATDLSSCSHAPRAAILALTSMPVDICRPILTNWPKLGPLDMLRIIENSGEPHGRCLAVREDLDRVVIRRLRELRSLEINVALNQNPALLNLSVDEQTQDKPDLTADEATHSEGAEARPRRVRLSTIQDGLAHGPQKDAQIMGEIWSGLKMQPSASDALMEAAARGGKLADAAQAKAQDHERKENARPLDLATSLEKIAAAKSLQGLATLMAKASGLTLETAMQVLEDTSGDTMAVFLKSHEIESAVASRILMLTFPAIGMSTQNAIKAIRFYNGLTVESCRDAVDLWPKATIATARHEPQLVDDEGPRGSFHHERQAWSLSEAELADRRAHG